MLTQVVASLAVACLLFARTATPQGAARESARETAGETARGVIPFARSLQIVAPGPQPQGDGLNYHLKLVWVARPGAAAYRVLMWTDAVRTWYRVAQTSDTSADVRAFRSGCSAFVVIALADPDAASDATGLESSNLVRFPLSAKPQLCPTKRP